MEPLLDEAFLARLSNLKVIAKGRRKGKLAGVHASPRVGVSVEFAEYREYAPGDDFRHIDWNVYGRLDRVLVKSFVHEADLPIYLLVDLSASMRLGASPKARYAARLAVTLAYLGLRGQDRVGLVPFTDRLLPVVLPRHGIGQMTHIVRALERMPAAGSTSIDRALSEFVSASRESGLVFLLSDFLSGAGYEEGFSRLYHRGDEVVVIQILDPDELRPTLEGDVVLADVETGRRVSLSVGSGTLALYGRRLGDHLGRLRAYLSDHRTPYILAPTDVPLEVLIHERLRAGGILQ
ncbi:MAG: DUF58 domain-containing protein [Candidatus Bipolaricaulis sp.]|nr:DUF58 domain-containing protein [Candidatus Bipolaricaulis sp.]MDD5219633.1 DUF58 domain-containing protein [Candidatus Bipolaricaulis sp.]MDD5645733.1 DUF58 domain-containing protein [Candidatus Bipolaricaulis sp.]